MRTEQPSLFGDVPSPSDGIKRGAMLSDDLMYRYWLNRVWEYPGQHALFVMLNPSIADHEIDDRTIGRCISFSRRWGMAGFRVVNLYAYRSTKPEVMFAAEAQGTDIVGSENDEWIRRAIVRTSGPIVAAWGVNARPERAAEVLSLPGMERAQHLGLTQGGQPGHPLFIKGDTELQEFP